MSRPPSPARCPIANWLRCLDTDEGLSQSARAHYKSMAHQVQKLAAGSTVIHRGCLAAWLETYRQVRECPADAKMAARHLAELTRTARTLDLLDKLDRSKRGLSPVSGRGGSVFK